jgi:hypothetical protein
MPNAIARPFDDRCEAGVGPAAVESGRRRAGLVVDCGRESNLRETTVLQSGREPRLCVALATNCITTRVWVKVTFPPWGPRAQVKFPRAPHMPGFLMYYGTPTRAY